MADQRLTAEDQPRPHRADEGARFFRALPILVMLAVWVVGAWFAWSYATGHGVTSRGELRTGTMTVAECHRSPVYAWYLFDCSGDVVFAPESTWAGPPRLLRGQTVTVLSPEPLTGQVWFTTYDPRKSSKGNYTEVALPTAVFQSGRSFAGAWPSLLIGAGVLVGGFVVAAVVGKIQNAVSVAQ